MLNTNSGISIADVAALTNNRCGYNGYGYNDGFLGGGNWFGGLIIGSLLNRGLFGGFDRFPGLYGTGIGYGLGANSQISNDFMYTNLSNQHESMRTNMANGFNQLQNNDYNVSKEVQQTNFNTAVGQAGLSKDIGQVGYQSAMGQKNTELEIIKSNCNTMGAIKDSAYQSLAGESRIIGQMKDCCCETNSNIKDLKNYTTQELCSLGYKMDMNAREIITSQKEGTQAIRDDIVNLRLENKDNTIAQLTAQINALQTSGIAKEAADAAVNRVLQLMNNKCGC